jgi:hypothetical protein
MNHAVRALLMLALVSTLVVSTAAAMSTSYGPALVSVLRTPRNVTRIDQNTFLVCMHTCETSQKQEVDTCNALGSAFRSMRLKNATISRPAVTVGQCVSTAAQKLRDCKKKCKPGSLFAH